VVERAGRAKITLTLMEVVYEFFAGERRGAVT
jgi:hypothetical protein